MLIKTIKATKELISEWKAQNQSIGLVPTMGALHAGHISLIEKSKQECDKTVVSIFVNPTQFAPSEDFDNYPRVLEQDLNICKELGVDVVFSPDISEMYEDTRDTTIVAPPFGYVDMLCGKTRTSHFDGVCTVVLKLFNIVEPNKAFFGLKDIQQFIIIKKMVKDLNVPVEIIGCNIVREPSGLALSSRNKYLDAEEKQRALAISSALFSIEKSCKQGITGVQDLFDTAIQILNDKVDLEYLDFVEYDTFQKTDKINNRTIVAIVAKVGATRLIDNIILNES